MDTLDPLAAFKDRQRAMWASFTPTAMFTTPVAATVVRFAGIAPGEVVLDVGTGTGVVAVTAARAGAHVTGLDLTPELLVQARLNAETAGTPVTWTLGDAEELPYADGSFDVVVSQFGHMFAPRPERAIAEMRRVLKPGGRIAFATWPPEHFVGRLFAFVARHAPPPPGVAPVAQWGEPSIVTQRLGAAFGAPFFARGAMHFPALSVGHFRGFMENAVGPVQMLAQALAAEPARLAAMRNEFEELVRPYFVDNVVRQDFLMVRANVA